jgi:hypothetical protein
VRGYIWLIIFVFAGSLCWSQTILGGDLNIVGGPGLNNNGLPGPLFLDFDISQPCPLGTTSKHGRALLCGNNNQVILSVNGADAFTLQPGGPPGPQGPPGQAATITVGTVVTLPPGSAPTVTNSGSTSAAILDFGIPEANPGILEGAGGSSAAVLSTDYALLTRGPTSQGPNPWLLPGAVTELLGGIVRVQADLSAAGCARLYTQIGENYGPVGSVMYFEYSTDGGLTWDRLTQDADISAKGAHVSPWGRVPSMAKRDVLVRAVADNGTNTGVDVEAVHLQVNACVVTSPPGRSGLRIPPVRPRIPGPRFEHRRNLQE